MIQPLFETVLHNSFDPIVYLTGPRLMCWLYIYKRRFRFLRIIRIIIGVYWSFTL